MVTKKTKQRPRLIVKVQKSQFDSQGKKRILIYNEDRSVYFTGPWLKQHDKLLKLGRDVKGYFAAQLINGQVQIDARVDDQEW